MPPLPKHEGSIAADANFLEEVDVNQVSSVVDLHRSNLLRIQTQELVQECTISPDKAWFKIAQSYMEYVSTVVNEMTLQDVLMQPREAPFSTRLSDRSTTTIAASPNDRLHVLQKKHPLLGMSTLSGNANVLPTFTLHVKIPTSVLESKDYLRNRYFDVSVSFLGWDDLSFLTSHC